MFRVACGSIRLANPPDVRGVHIAIAQLGVDRERRFATTRRLLTPKLQEKLDALISDERPMPAEDRDS